MSKRNQTKAGSPPVDYNPYEDVVVVAPIDEIDPFIENKNKIIDHFQRENVVLKAQLQNPPFDQRARQLLDDQRRENDLLRARLQAQRANEIDAYDRGAYDRIYTGLLPYVPLDQRLRMSAILSDLTRKRLIDGLSEPHIVSELRDMITELVKKPRRKVSKNKSVKKSSKRKKSSKKK